MTQKLKRVKAQFEAEGVSIAEWARAHGFEPRKVYRLLSGELKGKRGEGHRMAVALGLKEEPGELRYRHQLSA